MADWTDGGKQAASAEGGSDHEQKTLRRDKVPQRAQSSGRDDTIDEDLEQERLAPGLDAGGDGETGADPSSTHSDGNSNT